MRKTAPIAFALSLLLPLAASAQYKQGMVSLGASVFYHTYDIGSSEYWMFLASPTAAFAYSDNAMLGLEASLGMSKSLTGYPKDYDYSLAPFWRYNFPMTERGGTYGKALAYLNYSEEGYYDSHSWYGGLEAAFGAYYFIADHFSLEATFGSAQYLRRARFEDGKPMSMSNQWNVSLTNGLGLSLFYVF